MNHLQVPEDEIEQLVTLAEKLSACIDSTDFGHNALAKAYLTEFLLLTTRFSKNTAPQKRKNIMPVVVSKVFDYIETHLTEDLTINKIADDLHYSSDHLSRVFIEATGDSLKHYINGKKIVLAQKLLLQNYSPYDVCFMVGYNNYSSFSRRFSKQIGVSPKQFQLTHRDAFAG